MNRCTFEEQGHRCDLEEGHPPDHLVHLPPDADGVSRVLQWVSPEKSTEVHKRLKELKGHTA